MAEESVADSAKDALIKELVEGLQEAENDIRSLQAEIEKLAAQVSQAASPA